MLEAVVIYQNLCGCGVHSVKVPIYMYLICMCTNTCFCEYLLKSVVHRYVHVDCCGFHISALMMLVWASLCSECLHDFVHVLPS